MANEETPGQKDIELWLTELENAVKTLKDIAEHMENLVDRAGITHGSPTGITYGGPICHGTIGAKSGKGKRGGRGGRKRSDKGASQ